MITINTIPEEATKTRKVTIHKEAVYITIDAHTYKYVDANPTGVLRQENAAASDKNEKLDRRIMVELVEFRDAKLRTLLQTRLKKVEVEAADDIPGPDGYFFYVFDMPETYNDTLLDPLGTFIHRYLAFGALYDWYMGLGRGNQAAYYKVQLDELEREITSNFRGPSVAKRPLQPFGPAKHPGKMPLF